MTTPINLREIIREETKKCMEDPIYFMRKYVKIQHPNKGTIPFNLFQFQEGSLKRFHDDRFLLILKSRQLGITTLVAAYSLWLSIFNKDKSILVISIKQEVSKEIITKVRFANEHLPSWLKVKEVTNNHMSLRFENGSQVAATSSSKDAGRSKALSLLIIDEAAFIDEAADIWNSCFNTLSTGGRAIVLSTPNGVGNWFHKMWIDAERKKNDFKTLRLPWNLHPERDQVWRDEQTKQLGVKGANQECFSEDVVVYTKLGPKKISNINVGDEVLTHNGNYKFVNKIFKKLSPVKRLSSNNNFITKYVTDNHPFLTDDGWKEVKNLDDSDIIFTFPTDNSIPEETLAIDLYPIVKSKHFAKVLCDNDNRFYINDRKHKTIHNRYIDINYDFGFLIGLYLSEGSGCRLRKTFNFDYKKELQTWPEKLKQIVNEKFGMSKWQIRLIGNTGHLSFCSEIFSSTIDKFVEGEDCYTKKLSEFSYKMMSKEFAKGIIDGIFRGDGCLKSEYYKTFSTTSNSLFYDVSYLLNLLSITDFSMRQSRINGKEGVIDGRKFIYSDMWEIKIRNTKNVEVKELSDVIGISQINYTSLNLNIGELVTVYNLSVDDDNSYITEYGIVHNCDCDFLSSGTNVVDLMILKEYEENPKMICDRIEAYRGEEWWVFKQPEENHDYIISADVARGDGLDYSAAHVIDIDTLEQVAEYYGQLSTKDFGNELVTMATKYNDALLIIEYTGIGVAVLQQVIDREYKNTFYSSLDLKVVDVHKQMSNKFHAEEKKLKPGFSTTISTRPVIISKLEAYFRERAVTIHSSRLIQELKTFIWDNGKAQAAENYNDDLVMALGIGLWVRDTALRLRQDGILLTKTMLDKIHINQNNDKTPIYKAGVHSTGKDAWQMKTGGKPGDVQSLTWLLR